MITFKQFLLEITASTKDGHKITTYFETAQGSKYVLSEKGESKRIKSLHDNTGPDDVGLKDWMQHCVFADPKDEKSANAFQFLMNYHDNILISAKNGKITFMVVDNKQWRNATFGDAYPKAAKEPEHSDKKDNILSFTYVKDPKMGYLCVEFDVRTNQTVSSYHCGSPVSKIKKLSDMSETELRAFQTK
jgi:hypothetical protein